MKYVNFIKLIAEKHPDMNARKIVDVVFDAMKQVLLGGESVIIPGMCTLHPHYLYYGKNGRRWRNPHSGRTSIIYSKVQLRCKPYRSFQTNMTERLIDDR